MVDRSSGVDSVQIRPLAFDGLLAQCESKSVPGKLLPVQALEHFYDAALECRIYTRAVVFDGEYPIDTRLDEM
jgi:hypothetical protein